MNGPSIRKLSFSVLLLIAAASCAGSSKSSGPTVCTEKCDCEKPGEIDCDNQNLDTVAIEPVVSPESVRVLSLKSNQIARIKRQQILSGKGEKLVRLTLSNNLISQIDDNAFETTPLLESLDLSYNKLTNLTAATFVGLSNLVSLWLDHNLIENLATGSVFAATPNLRYLSVDWTPIKRVSNETFVGLEDLIELSIDHAELSLLPTDTFKPLSRVETLSLRHNRFLVVPLEELRWLAQLKHLDLSGNPIVTINSHSFRHNSHLHTLAFINMPALSYIEDCAFCNVLELRTLEIVNCSKLTDIDPESFGRDVDYFRSIETIDFVNNALTSLDEDTLPWDNVSGVIRLAGNPWKCDCGILWMTNSALRLDGADPPVCAWPSSLKGKPVPALEKYDPGLCISARLSRRIRAARLFLIAAVMIIVFGIITTTWYLYNSRRKNGLKLRNLFYKPQLPKYAYRNLAMGEEADQDVVLSNDGASILPQSSRRPNRDLASSLADDA